MDNNNVITIISFHINYRESIRILIRMTPASIKLAFSAGSWLLMVTNCDAFSVHSHFARTSRFGSSGSSQPTYKSTILCGSQNEGNESNNAQTVDVSDLGITMEDLEAPLPTELLQSIALQGVQSTSRIPTTEDNGCMWTENSNTMDVTLVIPGLRGQPAAALAVTFSTTTATVSAFGRAVWSCILKGEVLPETATFVTEDGIDMIPVVSLTVQKADETTRWGGFIEQIGEDSIL